MNKQEKSDYDREYRKKNRKIINAKIKAWRDLHLEDQRKKAAERFLKRTPKQIEKRRLWEENNAEKIKVYDAARRKANPKRSEKASKAWKAANPEARRNHVRNRRAKLKAGGILSKNIEKTLMERQQGKCPVCKISILEKFNLDHIISIASGGRNDDDNVQLLCPKCNQSKGAKHPVDFMQSRGFLL